MEKLFIRNIVVIAIFVLLFNSNNVISDKPPEVGVVEKLGDELPLDLVFTNSKNEQRTLKEIITKPTVLSLVYYNCPGICSPLLTSMSEVMDKVDLEPGRHFQAITISFDHREGPDKAERWKKNYLASMKRQFNENDWEFMVGDSVSIRKLTDAVGFYFKPDGVDYVHAGSLFILTPDGRISRYMLGTQYNPFDLKMSLTDAADGKSMPTIAKFLQFCYNYDPEGKTYVFNITKVAGTVIFLVVGLFFVVLLITGKSKKSKTEKNDEGDN